MTAPCAVGAERPGGVVSLDARRIGRAITQRTRYRYVRPEVTPLGRGWQVCSPNCSRSVDATGGPIPIAWLVPPGGGTVGDWSLLRRDHDARRWRLHSLGPLPELLDALCLDRDREFWL